jgi:hypothetical protein
MVNLPLSSVPELILSALNITRALINIANLRAKWN